MEWNWAWEQQTSAYQQTPWRHYKGLLAERGYQLFLQDQGDDEPSTANGVRMPQQQRADDMYRLGHLLPMARDPFQPEGNEGLCYATGGLPPTGRRFDSGVRLLEVQAVVC